MDLPAENLQFFSIPGIIKELVLLLKQSPRTFSLITLTIIFPLSFAILLHSLFTHPILVQLQVGTFASLFSAESGKILFLQFCYLIFLSAFSLLSTSAVVFTVASLYTSKPVSFHSTISAFPSVLKRLFVTFILVSMVMVIYDFVFLVSLVLMVSAVDAQKPVLFVFSFVVSLVLFLDVHVYFCALWHLASVVSVLEPIYGFAALRKSYQLLKGRAMLGFILVFWYLAICGVINGVFGSIVVHGADDHSMILRIGVGVFLVGVLVIVNLIGLLAQSVFYYVCKSYHHEGIDKSALHDHLGGYLGEYVPLESSVQLQNLDA